MKKYLYIFIPLLFSESHAKIKHISTPFPTDKK